MKKQLLAAASIASIAFAGLAYAAPAQALACGTPAFYINGSTAIVAADDYKLWVHGADGALLETVPMAESAYDYGDIALTADAQAIYAVKSGSANDNVIDILDPTTSAVTGSITITGDAAGVGGWVGAAFAADGKLIIGSNASHWVYKVDVTTGASTQWADLAAPGDPSPGIWNTTGDFAQLPDGDVFVLFTNNDSVAYYAGRISPDGVMTTLRSVVEAWGAGRVGDDIYLAQADGIISKIAIADIPTTGAPASLDVTTVTDTGYPFGLWGATGTEDSGTQTCALPNTGVDAGALGALGLGLGLAGAAGLVIARRKTA